jgi:hypothetical protein
MNITWEDVADAMKKLSWYVKEAGLWYTIASEYKVTDDFIDYVRKKITSVYGEWHA